jgi:hypothetical protein
MLADPKYSNVMVQGLLVLAWLSIPLFIITAINPRSKWALKIGGLN